MDEQRGRQPAPTMLIEVQEPVRKLLNTIDENDIRRIEWLLSLDDKKIQRFEQWDETLAWWGKTGRLGTTALYLMMAGLGAIVSAKTVWGLFFPGKGAP